MNNIIEDTYERSEELAKYIVETGCTVRSCAAKFGISKSTVHKDVTFKLKYINPQLYYETQKVLLKNKSERHLRGGISTKLKYLQKEKHGSV